MINEQQALKYCKDDLSKIENYDKAIADTSHVWDLHHRLELTLDGEFAHTKEDLIRMGMYFQRPYFELIFLTASEHRSLHMKRKGRSEETRRRISEAQKGREFTEETRQKLSEAQKGKRRSDDTRRRMSAAKKGRTFTDESKKKMSESAKARWARRHDEFG